MLYKYVNNTFIIMEKTTKLHYIGDSKYAFFFV